MTLQHMYKNKMDKIHQQIKTMAAEDKTLSNGRMKNLLE